MLRGAILDAKRSFSPEEYLKTLSDLSVTEIRVLRLILEEEAQITDSTEREVATAAGIRWKLRIETEMGLAPGDLDLALRRLQATGLAKEVAGIYYDYTGGEFIATAALKRLMQFLGR